MQITIASSDDRVINIELDENASTETLKAIVEAETNIPAASQHLVHNGNPLIGTKTIAEHGVQAGDLIMLTIAASPAPARRAASGASGSDAAGMNPDGSAAHPEALMTMLRSQLTDLPPALADAIRSNNIPAFQDQLRKISSERARAREEEERFLRLAEEDPFNPEVQRRLEETIQKKNVAENFENALEHNPEAFASVCMLYVDMEVNGLPLKAFIDSGAQSTIMSKSCAERCGILRLLDTRFQGVARGVGTAKILGRIHMCPMKAAGNFFPVSITVLDQEGMEFLFGLDNLKHHQCSIDLKDNVLRFGTSNTTLPFLAEHQITKSELFDDADGSPAKHQAAGAAAGAAAAARAAGGGAPTTSQGGGAGSSSLATGGGVGAQQPAVSGGAGGELPAGWEEKVQRMMALGFGREQCVGALKAAQGDEEMAGSLLFGAF